MPTRRGLRVFLVKCKALLKPPIYRIMHLTTHHELNHKAPDRATWGLSEKRLESFNSAAYELGKFMDRFSERLTTRNPRFVERYIKRELHILIEFSIRGVNEKFVAYLERAEGVGGPEKELEGSEIKTHAFSRLSHSRPGIKATESAASGKQKPVLVDIVKSAESPEFRALPSVIWFDGADRINSLLPHSLYFSGKHFQKVFGARRDWEASFVTEFDAPASHEKKLLGKIIKSAPEIVQSGPSNYRDFYRGRLDAAYIINQLSSLRIALGGDFVWCGLEKGMENAIKLNDILVGPINSVPN